MNKVENPSAPSSSAASTSSASSTSSGSAVEGAWNNATTGILTIDIDAIISNWRKLESRAVPAECPAVIKADAYGCGLPQVARALATAGCKTFFVATLQEARNARLAAPGAIIYVLDGCFVGSADAFAAIDARPVIGDLAELAEWDAFCRRTGWSGGAALHIDTGMNRLGITMTDAQGLLPRIQSGNHGLTLVMSHLACAESLDHPMNARQLATFREIAHAFTGIPASLANSSGIFLGTHFAFDMVRPGAALYGVNPTPEADNPMKQVVHLQARIVQVRAVPRGETVGYGGGWKAGRDSRIAVVAAGYADGYLRSASGIAGTKAGQVVVAGKRCPIVGRISMDLLAIDITDLPSNTVRRGHFVTLIGDGLTIDDVARGAQTIGYEILTNLGRRFQRVHRGAV